MADPFLSLPANLRHGPLELLSRHPPRRSQRAVGLRPTTSFQIRKMRQRRPIEEQLLLKCWRFRGLYLIRLNPPGFECLSSSPITASAVEKGPKQSACSFQSQASFGEVVCSRMQYHWPGSISAMWHSRWQLMISSAPAVSPPTLFPIRGLLDPGGQLRLGSSSQTIASSALTWHSKPIFFTRCAISTYLNNSASCLFRPAMNWATSSAG